jgi:hypothetical protein
VAPTGRRFGLGEDAKFAAYQWIKSYVAGDKIYCVHEAESEDVIREHSRRGGFPVNAVAVVANEFGPAAADRVTS